MGHTRGLHLKAEFERGNRADENHVSAGEYLVNIV